MDVKPAPRFLGWKHTPNAERFFQSSCRRACALGASSSIAHDFLMSAPISSLMSTFGLRPVLPTGNIPTAVATGDFNGDGHLDWVITNGGDNTVWLYLGHGDGTANLPTIIPLSGIGPTWVIAVSLRGNGILDLVVSEADTNTVGVLLGNGDGTFQTEVQYSVPAAPLFVLGADFNGDGKLDIAAGLAGSTVAGPFAILTGNGLGQLGPAMFKSAQSSSNGDWLAAADLNGDGKTDIVVVDSDDGLPHGGAQVYLNSGDGTFAEGQVFDANIFPPGSVPPDIVLSVALADVNGDGCVDAVAPLSAGGVDIFTGNCNGTFNDPYFSQYALGDIGGPIQLVDMNQDGHLDIVTSGVQLSGAGGPSLGEVAGNLVSVLLGDGTGHFSPGRVYRGDVSMYGLAVGDLNGDGFPDVITANQVTDTASLFLNDGKGGLGDPQGEPIGYNSGVANAPDSPFLFADVNGDGSKDIVLLETEQLYPGPVEITTLLNDGHGNFSAPIRSAAWGSQAEEPSAFVLGDFRNTGRPDLVALVYGPSSFLFFAPNTGAGSFGTATTTPVPFSSSPLIAADFNLDGKLDVAFATNLGNGYEVLCVYLGNGDGTFTAGPTFPFGDGSAPISIYAGDFNRDGKTDLLILADGLYELLGNGDGTFQPSLTLFGAFAPSALADINRDGWPDIVSLGDRYGNEATSVPMLSVFLGQPDGTFKFFETYSPYLADLETTFLAGTSVPESRFGAVLGDFNGDGNPDVLFSQIPWDAQTASFGEVMYGNGDGTFTPSYFSYSWGKRYVPQFALDVNGDGLADLIELDKYTASFNVLKSSVGAPALQLGILTVPVIGSTGWGKVMLNLPSTTAITVSLAASDPNVVVSSLSIPAGAVSQDFQFSVGEGFNSHHVFSIEAQVGTSTATAYGYVSTAPVPVPQFRPAALLFEEVPLGTTSTQSITLTNLGTAPFPFTTNQTLYFQQTNNCGGTVAPGASCTFQLTFGPPAPGQTDDTLRVFGPSSLNIGAELVGFGAPQLQIAPCCLTFFEQPGETSSPQTVVITNSSNASIQFNSFTNSSSAAFAESNNCTTLAPNQSCQVTVTFQPPAPGPYTTGIGVTGNFPSGNPNTIIVNGTLTDFSLSSGSAATVKAGQTATYSLDVLSTGEFFGTVNLTCSGAPAGAACTVTPTSVSVLQFESASFTATVTTTAPSSQSSALRVPLPPRLSIYVSAFLLALLGLSVRSRSWTKSARAPILALLVLLASCGGSGSGSTGSGGGGGGGGGGANSGTPPGTYALTITGTAGGMSHSTGLSLTVQ